jgi:protein-S-isoprenylcysteine O-methyltransferase Ste14
MNFYVVTAGTVCIIAFSWFLSIKHKRYHGVARFFAFESIFLLFLLNYRVWYSEPFSPVQIISWLLLFGSIYPVTAGFILLKRVGKPDSNFENTSVLVKSGIYGYIRHPLYLSVLLLGTGIMLKDTSEFQLILGSINLIALILTAIIEEREMIAKFGDEYLAYINMTKMFIPFVI